MELTSTFALRAAADNPRVACQPKLTSFGNDKRRLAERVGFEPTCPLRDKTLSRRPRYDHFGTSPHVMKGTCDYTRFNLKKSCSSWRHSASRTPETMADRKSTRLNSSH